MPMAALSANLMANLLGTHAKTKRGGKHAFQQPTSRTIGRAASLVQL
jgi:hypothetical protein